MAINIDEEMRRLYQQWCLDSGNAPSTEGWHAFIAGWQESSLFAAKAQEDERRWIAAGRPDDWPARKAIR